MRTFEMIHDNAIPSPYATEIARTRIHLVHSRSWQVASRVQKPARPRLVPATVPQKRKLTADILPLTAAALTVPLIWVGHALLHAIKVF